MCINCGKRYELFSFGCVYRFRSNMAHNSKHMKIVQIDDFIVPQRFVPRFNSYTHRQTVISIYTIRACGDRWVLLLLLLLLMPFQPLIRYRCVCITAFRSRRTCACLLSQLLIFICAWVIRNRLKD